MTRLGWNFLLLIGGIAFAALNTGNNVLYLLVGICLAILVVSFFSAARALRRIGVEVTFPEEILASDPTAFVVTLHNRHKRMASPAVEATLRVGPLNLPPFGMSPVRPGGSTIRFVPARFPERGLFRACRVILHTVEPFGLVRRRRVVSPGGELFVYPVPHATEAVENEVQHERGDLPARRVGEGLELHQIRAYQFDDDSRHIDWRASARIGELMIKEFLDEGSEHLVLVFDPAVERQDAAARNRFERQVSLAAGLIFRCIERRTPFRFVAPGKEFPEVDPPGGQRPALEYLATVQPTRRRAGERFASELDGTPGLVRLGASG